jgi:hypothetical protein
MNVESRIDTNDIKFIYIIARHANRDYCHID